jgi:hypothetical protein
VAALWFKGLAGKKNADRHDRPFHGLTDRGRPVGDAYARPHRADRTSRSYDTLKLIENPLALPSWQTRCHRRTRADSGQFPEPVRGRGRIPVRHRAAMPESRRNPNIPD